MFNDYSKKDLIQFNLEREILVLDSGPIFSGEDKLRVGSEKYGEGNTVDCYE